jgi:GH24 family phage-related lysozyme (muramidase)
VPGWHLDRRIWKRANKGRASLLSDIYDENGASKQLEKNLIGYSEKVLRVCASLNMKFDDDKFSALVSFTYNLGAGALKNMLTSYKNGMDINKAFLLYRFAKVEGVKTELPGLVRRRRAEAWLFTTGQVKLNF